MPAASSRCFHIGRKIVEKQNLTGLTSAEPFQRTVDRRIGLLLLDLMREDGELKCRDGGEPSGAFHLVPVRGVGVAQDRRANAGRVEVADQLQSSGERVNENALVYPQRIALR